ncbi:hypothetical protein KR222_004837 [Zaprionus bogoriensis]|nr:hypothetical protein KR222_004837 [Zaprionus bogoriensis]
MAQQFDINKRLMALLKNEIRAQRQMNTLAKQSSKLESSLAACNSQRLRREIDQIADLEQRQRRELEKRSALIAALRDQLAACRQRNAELQAELARTKDDHSELMGNVHALSEATDTYLNRRVLPERIRGVTASHSGDQWRPFDFERDELKGLIALWTQLQARNTHAEQWRLLLSAGSAPSDKENEPNVTASSIIEIDLTSPPSHK